MGLNFVLPRRKVCVRNYQRSFLSKEFNTSWKASVQMGEGNRSREKYGKVGEQAENVTVQKKY
jgi:hypothetical protein